MAFFDVPFTFYQHPSGSIFVLRAWIFVFKIQIAAYGSKLLVKLTVCANLFFFFAACFSNHHEGIIYR
jgi:uncharacterized membrane protein